MLVSELIRPGHPIPGKRRFGRLQDVIGDGPIEWFGQHVAGLRESVQSLRRRLPPTSPTRRRRSIGR